MNRIAVLAILFIGGSSVEVAQSTSEPRIQLLEPSDLRDGLGCSFDFAKPEGVYSLPGVVLEMSSIISKQDIYIRVNGKLLKLRWSPKRIRQRIQPFDSGAWSDGKVTIQLDCTDSSKTENGSYYDGVLEVRIGKKTRQYKVAGFCGC